MIYRFTIFAFCFFYFSAAISQLVNLVPNGSFEIRDECIYNDSNVLDAPPWFNPSLATPDVFHECAIVNLNPCPYPIQAFLDPWLIGIPTNFIGCQDAFDGVGYAGFFALAHNPFPLQQLGYKEYLAVRLIETLTAGTTYAVSFKVSLAERTTHAVRNLQVYFSPDSLFFDQNTPLLLDAQLSLNDETYLDSYTEWMDVSWEYVANGNESFIYIGNFELSVEMDTSNVFTGDLVNHFNTFSYYYIDDVQVTEGSLSVVNAHSSSSVAIIPNVSTGLFFVSSTELMLSILIYDLQGNLILEERNINDLQWSFNIESRAAGIYVAQVTFKNSKQVKSKIVKL